MNEYVTLFSLPFYAAMVWASFCALIRAERVGRCARPFVLPIFGGVASVILYGLQYIILAQGGKPPRDMYFAQLFVQGMLVIAVILLLVPHLRRRPR